MRPKREEDAPPIREFADRGAIWLLENPRHLRDLLQLMAADLVERLDFERAERVNRSIVPPDLYKKEVDLLFRIPFRDEAGEVWVYLLTEHQSEPDPAMGLRLLGAMVRLWEQQFRQWEDGRVPPQERRLYPVIPVVFYTGDRRWSAPLGVEALMDLPEMLRDYVPIHSTLYLSIRDTPEEVLARANTAIARILEVLRVSEAPVEVMATELQKAVTFLEALPPEAEPEWRRLTQYLLRLIEHKRTLPERAELYLRVERSVDKRHSEEVRTMVMTAEQAMMGQAQRDLVRRQLEAKFGSLPPRFLVALEDLTNQEVQEVAIRVLTANSLDDLGVDYSLTGRNPKPDMAV